MKTKMLASLALLISATTSVFAQTPMDPIIAKFNDGAAKVNASDFKTAIADFEEVIVLAEKLGPQANDLKSKSQTQLPVLYYQVASISMKAKKYDEAIPNLIKTIELADLYANNAPTKEKAVKYLPQLLTGVGSQKFKEKNYPDALKNFDDALKYDPNYAKAFLGKGLVFAEQFKEKEMLDNLGKAMELSKAVADQKTIDQAQLRLGSYYVSQGNTNLADVDPEDIDYAPAIASFEKALTYNPASADAFYMLAVIWNKSDDYDKAIQNGKKALESETDATKIAAINFELGTAYFGVADYTLACDAFNKAMVGPFAEKATAKKEKVPGCN
jgi:tetratricopeptide (TPR) repeat protein